MLFVSFGLFGLIWALTTKVESIRNAMPTVIGSSYYTDHVAQTLFPTTSKRYLDALRSIDKFLIANKLPYPGRYAVHLSFDKGSSAADIQRASQLPFVTGIDVGEGCEMTDEQFCLLNVGNLAWLHIGKDTQLTPKALEGVRFSKLQSLSLQGERFGDEVLPLIKGTPAWFDLNLTSPN